MDESDHRFSFNRLNKYVISLSAMIKASSSPLGPYLESDLVIYLYSDSTSIAVPPHPRGKGGVNQDLVEGFSTKREFTSICIQAIIIVF
jgi:hypothetical protein